MKRFAETGLDESQIVKTKSKQSENIVIHLYNDVFFLSDHLRPLLGFPRFFHLDRLGYNPVERPALFEKRLETPLYTPTGGVG